MFATVDSVNAVCMKIGLLRVETHFLAKNLTAFWNLKIFGG
jgi:hypothetical protein